MFTDPIEKATTPYNTVYGVKSNVMEKVKKLVRYEEKFSTNVSKSLQQGLKKISVGSLLLRTKQWAKHVV